jgi:endonuclease/exonuclease/phosphatase family metal-dependent hydrolase
MIRTITVATWNIGGGILGESHQSNGTQEIGYHSSILRKFQPDIVCLQEAHEFGSGTKVGQTAAIADNNDYPYHVAQRVSRSHLAHDAFLSLGILSRFPISDISYTQFQNLGLEATGPRGEKWELFDKGYLKCSIEVLGTTVRLINAHCFPLHYFGVSPTDPEFEGIWQGLRDDLRDNAKDKPTIVAIDLNSDAISPLLGSIWVARHTSTHSATRQLLRRGYSRTTYSTVDLQSYQLCK